MQRARHPPPPPKVKALPQGRVRPGKGGGLHPRRGTDLSPGCGVTVKGRGPSGAGGRRRRARTPRVDERKWGGGPWPAGRWGNRGPARLDGLGGGAPRGGSPGALPAGGGGGVGPVWVYACGWRTVEGRAAADLGQGPAAGEGSRVDSRPRGRAAEQG